ncbi:LysR family transcriptional regulator [Neobacillus sp. CF12]|uniref:LysR family transcriptional regulator n=1 Tax=Neobacillus sp. CF12 TaxID=3055864 RepID=UPI0025A19F1A|nr:LysR family transcriptional regulator [Neobacillus sp. CF12]MDM5327730.1 LysR family transcriptional regulator [Neobacillus sp. CF12]
MHIEQLEYIVKVAETGSISIAAEKLHVSQSGISQSITRLEEELGVKLFTRHRRLGAVPTPEGKTLIKKAYEVLVRLQEFKEEAQSFNSVISGNLKLSSIPGFMLFLLEPLSSFKNAFPNVNIEISEKSTQHIIEHVENNQIDIGLITIYEELIKKREDLRFEVILEGKMKVYVGKTSPLALTKSITPQQLMSQNVILYNGDYVKRFANDLMSHFGPMNILFTSDNTEVIKKAILEGLGVSFGPDFSHKNDPLVVSGEIVPIDIINYEQEKIGVGWVRSENNHFSINTKRFLEHFNFHSRMLAYSTK